MANPIQVMLRVKHSPGMAFSALASPFSANVRPMAGINIDANYSPVPIVGSGPSIAPVALVAGMLPQAAHSDLTYVIRGTINAEDADNVDKMIADNPEIIGIYADPRIAAVAVCPIAPVGSSVNIERLLAVTELRDKGMDGSGVKVVIVDTGVNLPYLNSKGKHPHFDDVLSWAPAANQPLGNMPVNHGTMCAYDVCIAAPACTIVDHALMTSTATGGSAMDGFLSDAVASYGVLLKYMNSPASPFAGDHHPRTLVVNNSWGMFNPSWDFPVGHPMNYSDNPAHPFNIIVRSLEAAGADILFAAGNCGPECPDGRCMGATDQGIYGANSSDAVISVAGVTKDKVRLGYSTKGPGRLVNEKPDIASFTHFAGSGVYPADGGTSAATPVAAGVVAAIRRLYPSNILSPAVLRQLLRSSAEKTMGPDFNYEIGYGVINVPALVTAIEQYVEAQALIPLLPHVV